jgi:hypothetical protein
MEEVPRKMSLRMSKQDEFGNVSFDGMHRVPLLFDDQPLFSEVFGRAHDELQYNSNEDAISVEEVLHYGKSGQIFRWLVKIVMKNVRVNGRSMSRSS